MALDEIANGSHRLVVLGGYSEGGERLAIWVEDLMRRVFEVASTDVVRISKASDITEYKDRITYAPRGKAWFVDVNAAKLQPKSLNLILRDAKYADSNMCVYLIRIPESKGRNGFPRYKTVLSNNRNALGVWGTYLNARDIRYLLNSAHAHYMNVLKPLSRVFHDDEESAMTKDKKPGEALFKWISFEYNRSVDEVLWLSEVVSVFGLAPFGMTPMVTDDMLHTRFDSLNEEYKDKKSNLSMFEARVEAAMQSNRAVQPKVAESSPMKSGIPKEGSWESLSEMVEPDSNNKISANSEDKESPLPRYSEEVEELIERRQTMQSDVEQTRRSLLGLARSLKEMVTSRSKLVAEQPELVILPTSKPTVSMAKKRVIRFIGISSTSIDDWVLSCLQVSTNSELTNCLVRATQLYDEYGDSLRMRVLSVVNGLTDVRLRQLAGDGYKGDFETKFISDDSERFTKYANRLRGGYKSSKWAKPSKAVSLESLINARANILESKWTCANDCLTFVLETVGE